MEIDIKTLAVILSLTNFVQVLALVAQYRLDRTHRGVGFWCVGSAAVAVGFAFNALRDHPQWASLAVAANNIFFAAGMAFLYFGFLRFFGRRENLLRWLAGGLAFTALIVYFTFVRDDLTARRLVISSTVAFFSFLIVGVLSARSSPPADLPSRFVGVTFLVNGIFFAMRGLSVFLPDPGGMFSPTLIQILTYTVYLVISMLWTFGVILMVNQRSARENNKAREYAELFFNYNPDAVLITRVSDGYFVEMNEGFFKLSGYTREEVIGKTTIEVNVWKNNEDRDRWVQVLREKGATENMEAVFRHKSGREIFGILSSRLIHLDDVPHVISVIRDITYRKEIETERERALLRLRTLSQAIEQSPVTTVITDLQGRIVFVNPKFMQVTGYSEEEVLGENPRVLKSGYTSQEEYKQLWDTITSGQSWHGTFHNKRKNGDLYWESATISAVKDENGRITNFLAVKEDITDRIKAEDELNKARALVNLLLESLPQNIYAKDGDGRFIFVNQQYCATEGRTREEILGKTDFDLHPAELAEKYRADDRRVIASGKALDMIEIHQPLGRNKSYVQVIKTPFKFSADMQAGVLGIFWDITERRRADEALRESQHFLSVLIENSGAIIFAKDAEGRYELVNKKWVEDVGIQRDMVIGKTDAEIFPGRVSEAYRQSDRQVIETRGMVETEDVMPSGDGDRYYVTIKFPLFHNDGELRGICGITTDITDRKRYELALKESAAEYEMVNRQLEETVSKANEMAAQAVRAEMAARENEEKFRELADLLPQIVFEADAAGRLTFVNRQAFRLFGYSESDTVLGRSIFEFYSPDSRREVMENLRRGELFRAVDGSEYTMFRRDGSKFQALVYATPILRAGEVCGVRGIIVDITDRKRLEDELHRQATTDSLTGIYNRRHMEQLAAMELKRALRLNHPLAVAVIDIDYFKNVNDTYGHAAGDQVLMAFRSLCISNIREIDLFGRFGGDEFCLLLPGSTCEQAYKAVERIRQSVESEAIVVDGKPISITISAGVAPLEGRDEDFDKLLIKADKALYLAKEMGRNKVACHVPPTGGTIS